MQGIWIIFSPFIFLLLNPLGLILVIAVVVVIKKDREYRKGAYYQVTKHPYLAVKYNLGKYGEYLTYEYLKEFEADGAKFLFNVYIPKENGETTEIDVLMICKKGIFVFESKNYSGWIFGNENQKNWYQTLPTGRGRSHKEHFYNPVMQNHSHIKHLRTFLGEQIPMRSIIVFSDRCTLKNVQVNSCDIRVINRYNVAAVVADACRQMPEEQLTAVAIEEIYKKLYPFTQVDETAKLQHIANIRSNMCPQGMSKTVTQTEVTEKTETAIEQAEAPNTHIPVPEAVMSAKQENILFQPLKCPRCNGDLVLRTATRGVNTGNQFYGCANYPKCRYIQNIKK